MTRYKNSTTDLDVTRMGGQAYSGAEARDVAAALRPTSHAQPLSVADIHHQTGVDGRTIRQIISDLDGQIFLIGKRSTGLFVCHYADEGDEYTNALDKHWRSEKTRTVRRRGWEPRLPRRQIPLFPPGYVDPAYLLDDDDDL